MPDLSGLPDFQTPWSTAATSFFAPFQGGSYAVLPQELTLAVDAAGTPKFRLDLVERVGDFSSTGQYAVLDFSLAGDFALDEAVTVARGRDPNATVTPIAVAGGFARLCATTGEVAPASDALAPVPLGLSGSDYVRWTTRLSADAGELIKGAVAGGSLLLGARVEFDVIGVAPRVAAVVEFTPAQLVSSLQGGTNGPIAASDVVAAFTGPASNLPVKIAGDTLPSGDFAGAMASRIFAAFATLAPSPGAADPPSVAFDASSQLPSGTIRWDLSQPALGTQQWVLNLDILTSLRAFAARNGIESLVRTVTVPVLQVGFCAVDFNANLPSNRLGVAAIGTNVQVAANPPVRPSSISQAVTFSEPGDSGSVQFRISPAEQLSYVTQGFAVIAAGPMVREYQMSPQPRTDSWVQLAVDDFPLTFAHVTAADRLLALASLSVVLTYTLEGQSCRLQAVLNPQTTGVAIAVPRAATAASLEVSATPADGGAALTLPPLTPGRIELDVTVFREFGPHRIAIHAALESDRLLALDLLAEERAADAVPDQIFLTAAQPSATWGYVASSPFRAGYQYRTSASGGVPPGTWSPVLSPFAALELDANGISIPPSGTRPAPAPIPAAT